MHVNGPWKALTITVMMMALSSCESMRNPVSVEPPNAKRDIQPMCQLGCIDPDPDSEAPGVFVGEAITDQYCLNSGGTDVDGDGLRDFCEKVLSLAFLPELRYSIDDDIRGEPYWAATKVDGSTVRIAYLFSYYHDFGATDPSACATELTLFGWLTLGLFDISTSTCYPHNGDSEHVVFDVYYDASSGHWVLGQAWYARHDYYGYFSRGAHPAPTELIYPDNYGGYPVVYVSRRKHASYENPTACDNGGPKFAGHVWPSDNCDGAYLPVRLEWSNYWNLGSSAHHLNGLDCVASRNPSYEYYGQGRSECYWSQQWFRGWVPDNIGGGEAAEYSQKLALFGF